MTSAQDKARVSAMTAGMAAVAGAWTFLAAFAPATLAALDGLSPWFDVPALIAIWALFSAIVYLLLRRTRHTHPASDEIVDYHCRERQITPYATSVSLCASREEKRHLGAITAGFALTISMWVAALSFLPGAWLNALNPAPVWFYCLVSAGLWVILSAAMYSLLSAAERRHHSEKAK